MYTGTQAMELTSEATNPEVHSLWDQKSSSLWSMCSLLYSTQFFLNSKQSIFHHVILSAMLFLKEVVTSLQINLIAPILY